MAGWLAAIAMLATMELFTNYVSGRGEVSKYLPNIRAFTHAASRSLRMYVRTYQIIPTTGIVQIVTLPHVITCTYEVISQDLETRP